MIFKIISQYASFLTREELTISQWVEKIDKFISFTGFVDDYELINCMKFEYNLSDIQIKKIEKYLKDKEYKYFRFSITKYGHFNIIPVNLDIKNSKGKLIYWKDWDYIFQQIGNDYFLWCYLGGITEIQREIKLSGEQVNKYKEIGFAQIDYLVDNLKKMNNSIEYEVAINENRRIL